MGHQCARDVRENFLLRLRGPEGWLGRGPVHDMSVAWAAPTAGVRQPAIRDTPDLDT